MCCVYVCYVCVMYVLCVYVCCVYVCLSVLCVYTRLCVYVLREMALFITTHLCNEALCSEVLGRSPSKMSSTKPSPCRCVSARRRGAVVQLGRGGILSLGTNRLRFDARALRRPGTRCLRSCSEVKSTGGLWSRPWFWSLEGVACMMRRCVSLIHCVLPPIYLFAHSFTYSPKLSCDGCGLRVAMVIIRILSVLFFLYQT